MNRQDILTFFDALAPDWDKTLIHDDKKIAAILDYADIGAGARVLDVACGTGVLLADYLARNVQSVTGVDLSPAMIRRAKEKFPDPRITLLAGDILETAFLTPFDRCMVYNALPHFSDPKRLIDALADRLDACGRLTIAHGMSRDAINRHHGGAARSVSMGLLPETELAACMAQRFTVDVTVSNDDIYVVSGVKR